MGSITREELAAKLTTAARKLGFEGNMEKAEKESMPKPPDSFEAFGRDTDRGRIHAYVF